MNYAIVMVGAPGSGKSSYVKQHYPNAIVCSADHYHMVDGQYKWKPENVAEAHRMCLRKFVHALQNPADVQDNFLVCDNTNTTLMQAGPYVATALAHGWNVKIVAFKAKDYEVDIIQARGLHNVPIPTVRRMVREVRESWTPGNVALVWPSVTFDVIGVTETRDG